MLVLMHFRKLSISPVRLIHAETAKEVEVILLAYMIKYSKIYPEAVSVLEDLTSLFAFYFFPVEIRRSIYSTNLIFPQFSDTESKTCPPIPEYNQSAPLFLP